MTGLDVRTRRARIGNRRWSWSRVTGGAAAGALALLAGACPAAADYTASLSGVSAIVQGDESSGDLTVTRSGGVLRHNRFAAGDAGFASNADFDTSAPGVQTLPAAEGSSLRVQIGGGASIITLGGSGSPARSLGAAFDLRAGRGAPSALVVDDQRSGVDFPTEPLDLTLDEEGISASGSVSHGIHVSRAASAPFLGGVSVLTGGAGQVRVVGTSAGEPVRVTAGAKLDLVEVGPLDRVRSKVTVSQTSGAPRVRLHVNDAGDTHLNVYTITPGGISRTGEDSHLAELEAEGIGSTTLTTGERDDMVRLEGTTRPTAVSMGAGNDTLEFADGATLSGGTVDGGSGRNTLAYELYTSPVVVNLDDVIVVSALLTGDQEVPPNPSQRLAGITMLLSPADLSFDLRVDALPFRVEELIGAQIRRGPAGARGSAVFDLGGREHWVQGGPEVHRNLIHATFPASELSRLLAGNTYVEIRTAQVPTGELRGQLFPIAGPHSATGTGGVANVSVVVGGLGSSTLVGSAGPDLLIAGAGTNELRGRGGDDTVVGGYGLNILAGDRGNDLVVGGLLFNRMLWHAGPDGNDGNDLIQGGHDLDNVEIYGSEGDDTITPAVGEGPGTVFISGSTPEPFELLLADVDGLILNGEGGDDRIAAEGSFAGNTLLGLNGGTGDDALTGADGPDQLNGGTGSNILEGRGGDDTFHTGLGADTIDGGKGRNDLHFTGTPGGDVLAVTDRTLELNGNLSRYRRVQELRVDAQSGNDRIDVSPSRESWFYLDGADGLDRLIYHSPGVPFINRGGSIAARGYFPVIYVRIESVRTLNPSR
jgi:Ca2+-binding RTX toxin-like protein